MPDDEYDNFTSYNAADLNMTFTPRHDSEYLFREELLTGAHRKVQMVDVIFSQQDQLVFDLGSKQYVIDPDDLQYSINHSNRTITKLYQPKQKESQAMNENIELLNLLQADRGVKTCVIRVGFKTNRVFKVPPKMELSLNDKVLFKQDDDAYSVGEVVGLHDEAEFDFDRPISYDWIIQKLDLEPYNALLAEEKSILKRLRRAAAYERLKRTVEAGGFDLDKIETPLLSSTVTEEK